MLDNYWEYFHNITDNPPINEEQEENRMLELENEPEYETLEESLRRYLIFLQNEEEREITREINKQKEIMNG